MHIRIIKFLEDSNCFHTFQFGFRLNFSTNTAFVSIIEITQSYLDQGEYAAGIFVDLNILLTLSTITLSTRSLNIMASGVVKKCFRYYLTRRKQFVSIGNFFSTTKNICNGVHKTLLWVHFVLIYVNDYHVCVKHSKTYHFADDISILHSHK